MFCTEYLKVLKSDLETEINHVTSFVVEDYAHRVGKIEALRTAIIKFEEMMKAYFNNHG